jgi:hypothetical protein
VTAVSAILDDGKGGRFKIAPVGDDVICQAVLFSEYTLSEGEAGIFVLRHLSPELGSGNSTSAEEPGVGQRVAATVPKHVRVDGKGHTGALAEACEQRPEALGCYRAAGLGDEDVRARALLALQAAQSANLVAGVGPICADLKWPTETRLAALGGKIRTQKCRRKLSL